MFFFYFFFFLFFFLGLGNCIENYAVQLELLPRAHKLCSLLVLFAIVVNVSVKPT